MAGQPDPNGTGIVYDARIQQLTATLGQAITNTCLDLTSLTNTCPPEEIDLILSTTSAHTFTFILLIIILIVRPTGILGERVAEKV